MVRVGRAGERFDDRGPLGCARAFDRIREEGYATDDGELIAGMAGVAAPIVTDADVHGAIAVYSASEEFEADRSDSPVVDMVRDAADEIQANLIFAHD